jgi:hypothetical protein
MKKTGGAAAVALLIGLAWCQVTASAPIAGIFTYHYDNARDGLNSGEAILTLSNVNSRSFGKVFSRAVDGDVYAEPLDANGVQIPRRGAHEVVYVATEHDSVYAFDASGAISKPLWKVSFINPKRRVTTVPWQKAGNIDIYPEVGITGTPVIDPASNTLYVSAATMEKGNFFHRLHALDIATGQEKFGGPVVIDASVPGTGEGNDGNGHINFIPQIANQRAGLALYNGVVYVAFAAHGDLGPYHGWVLGYDASTLQQVSALAMTPNGSRGGIWMSGGAPTIDAQGNFFVSSGNGTFEEEPHIDYGDSLVKLGPTDNSNFDVIDFFTPYDQGVLEAGDLDFGSSGIVALPDQDTAPQHLLFSGSKEGTLYLLDRDNLGHFHHDDDSQIVQSVMGQTTGVFSTPAYFNGMVYVAGNYDNLAAFTLSNGQLSTTPSSFSTVDFPFSGTTPVVSANDTQNGIVWAIRNENSAVLCAFDATNLRIELYNSSQRRTRDAMTDYVKFTVPTVANGRVFVGSHNRLTAFGLLKRK